MSTYWLKDPAQGIIGPVSPSVARDLIVRHQVPLESKVSVDGKNWGPIESFKELQNLLQPASRSERAASQAQEAQRIRLQLDRFHELPPHELFGVPRSSPLEVYRQAFQTMTISYNPSRLPQEVHRDLREAHRELFEFLSERFHRLEAQLSPKPAVALPTELKAAPRLEEIATIGQNASGKVTLWMSVTPEKMGIFTDHRLVNLSTGGAFFCTREPLRLGTQLELTFHFEPPPKDIQARGVVILENALSDPRQTPGFGIRLERLSAEGKNYIHQAVAAALAMQQAQSSKRSAR